MHLKISNIVLFYTLSCTQVIRTHFWSFRCCLYLLLMLCLFFSGSRVFYRILFRLEIFTRRFLRLFFGGSRNIWLKLRLTDYLSDNLHSFCVVIELGEVRLAFFFWNDRLVTVIMSRSRVPYLCLRPDRWNSFLVMLLQWYNLCNLQVWVRVWEAIWWYWFYWVRRGWRRWWLYFLFRIICCDRGRQG